LERPLNEYERFAVAEKLAFKTIFHDPYISCNMHLYQIYRTCGTMYSTYCYMFRWERYMGCFIVV
jgi:hypothetical protein